ncbi:uncharacterized protein LOC127835029 [Dreissena polymorpha]|uniref:uncharacterized protein LOC127835029 n=1 Tax=Dreissena polymorpha TaxID=45954 RepID=UPI002263B84A|nr:uncharacterized protein LOC127835029 [Dreissena polymorpha]
MEQSGQATDMNTSIHADPQHGEYPHAVIAADAPHVIPPQTKEKCATETKYCDLCALDNIKEDAVGFCTNCTDFLCKSCLVNHKRIKVTRSHTVLQGEDIPADIEPFRAFRALVKCEFHPEYDLTYMCTEHSIHVCAMCLTDKHRMCKQGLLNVSFNEKEDDFVNKSLLDVEARTEQITLQQEKYIKHIPEDQNKAIAEAQYISQQLIEKIVTLTTKVIDEITDLGNKEINITKTNINNAYLLYPEIRQLKTIMETAQKYGSAEECIVASRRFDARFKDIITQLSSLESFDQKRFSISKLQEIDKLNRICHVSFASGLKNELVIGNASDELIVDIERNAFMEHSDSNKVRKLVTQNETLIFKCNKDVQTLEVACACAPRVHEDILRLKHNSTPFPDEGNRSKKPFMERSVQNPVSKYYVKSPNDVFHCCITAIQIVADGKVLLADRWNRKVKLLSPEFVILDECVLTGDPIDLCVVEDYILVCCSHEKKVFSLCIDCYGKLGLTGCFSTKFWPVSISHFDDRVIILFIKEAECFDLIGNENIQIEIRNGSKIDATLDYEEGDHYYIDNARRILTLENGSVVFAENDRVSCYVIDEYNNVIGERIWYYKNYGTNPLFNARGIAHDSEDNVYICGYESNNIHQVSSQTYRHNRVLMSNINRPYSVCVDSKRGLVIVGCNQDDRIYVIDFL